MRRTVSDELMRLRIHWELLVRSFNRTGVRVKSFYRRTACRDETITRAYALASHAVTRRDATWAPRRVMGLSGRWIGARAVRPGREEFEAVVGDGDHVLPLRRQRPFPPDAAPSVAHHPAAPRPPLEHRLARD